MKLLFLLLFFLYTVQILIAVALASGQGVTYCVKPNASAICDTEDHCQQCHTLQYYINNLNTTINRKINVTTIFTEGTHRVTITAERIISVPILKMIGKDSVVEVVCNHYCNCLLSFNNSNNISIKDLTIVQSQQRINPTSIRDCHFSLQFQMTAALLENVHMYNSAIFVLYCGSFTIQGDSKFANCSSHAIISHASYITLSGKVAFVNNTGTSGAALYLSSSDLKIAADANIMFINNSATDSGGALYLYLLRQIHVESGVNLTLINNLAGSKGGAVYIGPDYIAESNNIVSFLLRLRYILPISSVIFLSPNCSNVSVYISFSNNFAATAGDDFYGTSLQIVYLFFTMPCYSLELSSRTSSFSSDPLRVCLCDSHGTPQCTNSQFIYNISRQVHPGEGFTASVVLVGYDFRPTTGIVYANLLENNNSAHLKLDSTSQKGHIISNSKQCTNLSFSVFSEHEISQTLHMTMYLTAMYETQTALSNMIADHSTDPMYIHLTPISFNITLLKCPPGFTLKGDHCDCSLEYFDNCTIVNGIGYFTWNTAAWVSIDNDKLLCNDVCAHGYCKITKRDINLQDDSDSQCALNRAGRLCGGCKANYSLAIGSSHCIHCPNNYNLALLIFFAGAGFLLVFFIGAFNLTVTQGMIDGLVFYANIVWTYQSIFFPQELISNPVLTFLKTFIAWINLDFGIETCFVDGLNALWKAGLQFVFPFYIWIITGLITMAAKYSTRLTNLLGSRGVPVLGTLFLLSYVKLLQTSFSIMQPSTLTYCDDKSATLVWSKDGNINYTDPRHIVLLVAGFATLLFLLLPYTVLMLLIQCFRKLSNFCLLKLITKLHPVFDAYFAPLKHKHQYWFGVLLLARAVTLITFVSTSNIPQSANVFIIFVIGTALLLYMTLVRPYKSLAALMLQSSFLANLVFLSGSISFTYHQDMSDTFRPLIKTVAVTVSTGVAFLQFCGIVFYPIFASRCSLGERRCSPHKKAEVQHLDSTASNAGYRDSILNESQPLVPTY